MKKNIISAVIIVIAAAALAVFVYFWGFCRFYVPPEHMAVITAKSGKTPAAGALLVEVGEKGIWKEVLPEGRYFLDPVMHDVKIVPAINIPIGKVGVVTSKVGKPLAPGEIIAPDKSFQGIWREVLTPGVHRLNPEGYKVDIVDAINIPFGYVGVVTSQTGKPAKPGEFAKAGEKGVLQDVLQPGLYYINPRAYQVNVIEIGMNQVSMTGETGGVIAMKNRIAAASNTLEEMSSNTLNTQLQKRKVMLQEDNSMPRSSLQKSLGRRSLHAKKAPVKSSRYRMMGEVSSAAATTVPQTPDMVYSVGGFVEFPSRDGFKILMDMTVEFELMPEHIAKIYMLYGDLPQVVSKIILPQILSVTRMKGSSYRAQDFIVGEGREIFQNNLRSELEQVLREKSIVVHNAIIRNVTIPANILKPIQEASLAVEQNLTNYSLQETAKIEAELNLHTAMIEQKRQEIEQETRKITAEIAAQQKQSVRLISAGAELEVAQLQLKRSELEAARAKLKGETDVKVAFMRNNERALGVEMKAQALGASGVMADLMLVEKLNPNVKLQVIYAGDGTLWTDLKSGS
ncbi:MAG: hypothetical protein J6Q81_05455, partial [Lentisphaeria bacterium]|nr:hypothetical protein [Lentisphaeria bacterium]